MNLIQKLIAIPDLTVRRGVPLAEYTTFRIGGPAEILVEARTELSLFEVLTLARRFGVPLHFLGGGSNLLISDSGLAGITLVNRVRAAIWRDNEFVTVSGGFLLEELVEGTVRRGWRGLEFAAGIPGTVGGALAVGAGAYGRLVSQRLAVAQLLDPAGNIKVLAASQLGITYRSSEVRERGEIILSAVFYKFRRTDPAALQSKVKRIKAKRADKLPGQNLPSAGSFFKNLPPREPGGQRIPAGKILDEAGVKGMRVGDAQVFEKHANIIVNRGHATAAEVIQLSEQMAQRVRQHHGLELAREVVYWE